MADTFVQSVLVPSRPWKTNTVHSTDVSCDSLLLFRIKRRSIKLAFVDRIISPASNIRVNIYEHLWTSATYLWYISEDLRRPAGENPWTSTNTTRTIWNVWRKSVNICEQWQAAIGTKNKANTVSRSPPRQPEALRFGGWGSEGGQAGQGGVG